MIQENQTNFSSTVTPMILVFFSDWSVFVTSRQVAGVMGEEERDLEAVVKNLAACLATRLGLNPPSAGLDASLLAALGKRLGIKGEVTMLGLLIRMGDFGLDLAHIEVIDIRMKQ